MLIGNEVDPIILALHVCNVCLYGHAQGLPDHHFYCNMHHCPYDHCLGRANIHHPNSLHYRPHLYAHVDSRGSGTFRDLLPTGAHCDWYWRRGLYRHHHGNLHPDLPSLRLEDLDTIHIERSGGIDTHGSGKPSGVSFNLRLSL